MDWVVDTNVLVVANDRNASQALPKCIMACVWALQDIQRRGRIVLDDGWAILREYQRQARSVGQPGVGDVFLKWVLTNQANPARCRWVSITRVSDAPETYAEFPNDPNLAGFDPSDRKFVAVALVYGDNPPILNAVDSDWWDYREPLTAAGVRIEFLCPEQFSEDASDS